jgi:hypothetical protein
MMAFSHQMLFVLWGSFFLFSQCVVGQDEMKFQFQETSVNWEEAKSTKGTKFAARNSHATTNFNGVLYLCGGKSDYYEMWKNLQSVKRADIWTSTDGRDWTLQLLEGDYYAQNWDALQPGSVAPWYERFGHSLDAVDLDGDGVHDFMVLLGGFTPDPMNDVWLTTNGTTWSYAGESPFSGRGWHSTVIFNGKLHVIGGSPLNNEVWRLETITETTRHPPDTRATYLNFTYDVQWTNLGAADHFSPRAGASLVSQWYYNTTANETMANSTERMVLIGGFGGWLQDNDWYDGFRSRGDTWASTDGTTWLRLSNVGDEGSLPARAWSGAIVLHEDGGNVTKDAVSPDLSPRIWIFGGGYIGNSIYSTKVFTQMDGLSDAYFSRDGKIWTRINYEQGDGVRGYDTYVQYYSSQEWTGSIVDSATAYLGLWGHTMEYLNGSALIIAGDKDRGGSLEDRVFVSQPGLFCDIEGIICSNIGVCDTEGRGGGCKCPGGKASGEYCHLDSAGEPIFGTPPIGL